MKMMTNWDVLDEFTVAAFLIYVQLNYITETV